MPVFSAEKLHFDSAYHRPGRLSDAGGVPTLQSFPVAASILLCQAAGGFFLAISEFTRKEMVELWHLPPEKIHIVPCTCSPALARETTWERLEELRKKYGLPERFILFVGNSNPRKNLMRLLKAFDGLKERGRIPHQLVVAGEQGWKFDRENALRRLKHREAVRFVGFVPDGDMPALYSAASLFAFPTLYEGFGIPVLEAQSCGVPVLASDCSALPEVGGKGALYVNPYDESSIAEGMWKLLTNRELAAELTQAGYENVKRFSWERSSERLSEIIEKEAGHGLDEAIPPVDGEDL